MNEKERRGASLGTSEDGQTFDKRVTAWPLDLLAEFSTRECRYLVFLRWLYWQGRLTEWCQKERESRPGCGHCGTPGKEVAGQERDQIS